MPHTKSAKKRMRQNERRRLHNRSLMSRMRSAVRSALDDAEKLAPGASPEALVLARTAAVRKATSELDKAARRRLIHPNAAARSKSRLAKRLAMEKSGDTAAAR